MHRCFSVPLVFVFMLGFLQTLPAQQSPTPTLAELPGYASYLRAGQKRFRLAKGGRVSEVQWAKNFKKVSFKTTSGTKTYDLAAKQFVDKNEFERYIPPKRRPARRGTPVPRAEQRKIEPSHDGKWNAFYRDFNVVIKNRKDSENRIVVTTMGNEKLRYGTCCWVYGEELDQKTAMWWSPDDRFLAFYEVSESHMRDYYLTVDNTRSYTRLHTVRYPKAGDPNPKTSILIYEISTKKTVRAKIDGPETQYLYNIRWTPSGDEILLNRTNRHQNTLDVIAVNPTNGDSRIVLTEKQKTWQDNAPEMRFLADGKRFVWATERNGWKNYELRDLSGKLINQLTQANGFPVNRLIQLDEKSGWMYYSASSAENPYNNQLHRVKLDGSRNSRITTSPLNHTSFTISPDDEWVIATYENINTPPTTVLYSADGKEVATFDVGKVAESDQRMVTSELFQFTAADGKTKIYGTLYKPSSFDPNKKYPLLIDVYGGPNSRAVSNRFSPLNPYCEFGFCIAKIANRGTAGRGKEFTSMVYMKLGGPDIQDQADGVKELTKRSYIDGNRVGIYGHSYGGYMSALGLLKYPETFHVAVAGAPVTKWENYDTIYTERYMRTPQDNPSGYKDGSCMEYAKNLKGKLLLVHGLIDDNVHPSNSWQLAEALHKANKRFDLQIYPNYKHGIRSTYSSLRWEYLIKNLQPNPK